MNDPLDSRQLRAFVALARQGSFTVAARQVHLSQSAVSHSIKALEQEVGCRLFDRMGKKVSLTQAGETLLHFAEQILDLMAAGRNSLEHLGKWGSERLRVGASATACQYILPTVLQQLKEKFPRCIISIEPANTEPAVELLRSQQIDLAMTLEPSHEPQFEFFTLFTDELQFLVGPMHPWATSRRAPPEEIPKQNYILYNKGSYTFRMIEDYFARENMVLNTVMDLGNMEAIKELLKLGLGVSILAAWTCRKELQEKALVSVPLGRRKLKRDWGVLSWRDHRMNLAEETFVRLCREVTRDFGETAPVVSPKSEGEAASVE